MRQVANKSAEGTGSLDLYNLFRVYQPNYITYFWHKSNTYPKQMRLDYLTFIPRARVEYEAGDR